MIPLDGLVLVDIQDDILRHSHPYSLIPFLKIIQFAEENDIPLHVYRYGNSPYERSIHELVSYRGYTIQEKKSFPAPVFAEVDSHLAIVGGFGSRCMFQTIVQNQDYHWHVPLDCVLHHKEDSIKDTEESYLWRAQIYKSVDEIISEKK